MTPRRLSFSRYGVFDLDHLLTLAGDPSIGLLVSERTKHLLNNLAIEDIQDPRRYAVSYTPEGYEPLTEEDSEWPLFVSVAEGAQRELVDPMLGLDTYLTQLDKRAGPVKGQGLSTDGIAGTDDPYILEIGPVPSNQIWLVTQVSSALGVGTFTSLQHAFIFPDPLQTVMFDGPVTALPSSPFYHIRGAWYLGEGVKIRAYWFGPSTDAHPYLRVAYGQWVEPL